MLPLAINSDVPPAPHTTGSRASDALAPTTLDTAGGDRLDIAVMSNRQGGLIARSRQWESDRQRHLTSSNLAARHCYIHQLIHERSAMRQIFQNVFEPERHNF
ncbi:hypothetical protein [Microcoleus sp. OTE_8_concoct_300]|uniref:hypothetical protein n=1 Tax=Microcoleus sp. OTE_8_concoct_300 TaxID=2964710 RepID=UPI00403F705D